MAILDTFNERAATAGLAQPALIPCPGGDRPAETRAWRAGVLGLGLLLFWTDPVFAGPLDWLRSKQPAPRSVAKTPLPRETRAGSTKDGTLPDFFATEAAPDTTGKNLNLVKFAESHWTHSKKTLEGVTREICTKVESKRCSDIALKLFVIDTQTYKEVLKIAARTFTSLVEGSRILDAQLGDMNRIITAPREETLDNLQKTLAKVAAANESQMRTARAGLAAAEGLIALGSEGYQTLELIPSLSITSLDIYVQASKQVMRQIQSSNEALKGLLLNVVNTCEQVGSGLELITATLQTTLRFSDHFAFKQFPLINLPVPAREKLFSHMDGLKNTAKGMQNTLSIGDSQVKNTAQQYTHLLQGAVAKMRDGMKYQSPADLSGGNLPQISNYALNQVSGLYQRMKEGLAEMRIAMGKAGRQRDTGGAPRVSVETPDQMAVRNAASASDGKLPLFLLGAPMPAAGNQSDDKRPPAVTGEPEETFLAGTTRAKTGRTTVLYSESKEPTSPLPDRLMPDEMGILKEELGASIPYLDKVQAELDAPRQAPETARLSTPETDPQPVEGISDGRVHSPSAESGSFGDFDAGEDLAKADLPDQSADNRDYELLRMETPPSSDGNGEFLPMFRLDELPVQPEKE